MFKRRLIRKQNEEVLEKLMDKQQATVVSNNWWGKTKGLNKDFSFNTIIRGALAESMLKKKRMGHPGPFKEGQTGWNCLTTVVSSFSNLAITQALPASQYW